MSAGTLYVAIKGDTKDLVAALKSAKNASVSYGKGAKQAITPVGAAIDGLKRNVLALGATWLGAQGIRAVINIADQYSLLYSKIRLVSKGTTEFNSVYGELFNISQKTGSSFASNASNYANLSLALKDTNITSEETLKIFESVNKSLVVAGATTQEASSFMLQFRQAMGSGKLAGDEFRGMMESNSYFGGLLAKALDTDVAGLREMSKEGKLTTDVLRKAFPEMAAEIDKDFSGIEKTISRAMVELSNAFNDVIADANRTTGGTSSVAEAVSELAKTITENKETFSSIFQGIVNGASAAVQAISDVHNAITKIGDTRTILALREEMGGLNEDLYRAKEGWFGFGKGSQEEITALERKVASLKELIDELESGEGFKPIAVTANTSTEAIETTKEASEQTVKTIVEGIDKVSKKEAEALAKHQEAEAKRYAESVKTTNMQIAAMNGLQNAQHVAADSFMRLEELKADSAQDATDDIQTYYMDTADDIKEGFSRETADFLVNSFDNIGDSWKDLWDGMVGIMKQAVSTMAANYITSGLNRLLGLDYFHTGAWKIGEDEQLAVLLKDEMVIPAGTADKLREIAPNGFSDLEGIASALSGSSSFGSSPVDRALAGDLGSMLGKGFRGSLAATLTGQVSPAQALTGIFSLMNPASLAFAVGGSLSKSAAVAYESQGAYGSLGSGLGSFGTALGLATLGITAPAVGIGALLAGVVGSMAFDAIGDALDDREFEGWRDAVESGLMTPSEFQARVSTAQLMGVSGGSKFGSFVDSVESAVDGALEALGIKDGISAVKGFFGDIGSAIGFGGNGSSGPDAGYGSSPGGDVSTGGYGRDLWFGGGVPTRVYGPGFGGDDGFVSFKLGEGIVSQKGMKNLEQLNDTGFQGEEVKSILLAIAVNTSGALKMLKRFEYEGIPTSNRVAVA